MKCKMCNVIIDEGNELCGHCKQHKELMEKIYGRKRNRKLSDIYAD
jgi:RNA polymerase subunit RPABC4/transcription elongation factor Spt4